MSSRDGYISDYEPVTPRRSSSAARRGGTDAGEADAEWPARRSAAAAETPEHDGEEIAPPASAESADASAQKSASARGEKKTPTPERWSAKRGHALSYLFLFLFTFILYYRPYEQISALASFRSMAFWVGILTLAVFVPTQISLEGTLTARPREVTLILLLCVTALLSMPLAISPGEAWDTFSDSFLKAVLIFIVMVNVVRTEWRLKGIIALSLAVSAFLGLSAIGDYRSGNLTVEGYRIKGAIGNLFGNPNDMAIHLTTMLPLAVVLALGARNLVKKALYAGCALLMTIGTVLTYSRGGFLGLMTLAGVLSWKLGRRNRLLVVLACLACIVLFAALVPGNYALRVLSIFDHSLDTIASASSRTELLKRSIITSIANPVFGVGMGNFHIVSISELVSHNSYTQVSAEMGLAALAIYVLFIVTPLRGLKRVERETFAARGRASQTYYLAVGLQASLVCYMVVSFFGSVAYLWYVYYLVAYAVCLRRIHTVQTEAGATADDAAVAAARGRPARGGDEVAALSTG